MISIEGNSQNISLERVMPTSPSSQKIADLYAVEYSSSSFSDVDKDGDMDLLVSGINTSNLFSSIVLYINDGNGNYSQDLDFNVESVYQGDLAFADIDNDLDEDIFITGKNKDHIIISKLYINLGNGKFQEDISQEFASLINSSIAFADIDNDNDLDLTISGGDESDLPITRIYINDGLGKFEEDTKNNSIIQLRYSSLGFSDVDNDDDQDLIISGYDHDQKKITKLYNNNGDGVFTEDLNNSFVGLYNGDLTFVDIDNDNDDDLFISGSNDYRAYVYLYVNDGLGKFSLNSDVILQGVSYSALALSDFDGNGFKDIVITGFNGESQITNLYLNQGFSNFILSSQSSILHDVMKGSVSNADIDDDGDEDLLITGDRVTRLYENNGNGIFTPITGSPFISAIGSVSYSDIDNDGDEDVLISGTSLSKEAITKLYKNNGLGVFSEVQQTPFVGVHRGSTMFLDVDNDGDDDLIISGNPYKNGYRIPTTKLYINDGVGEFTEATVQPFVKMELGSIDKADIDGDNDLDVLITGMNYSTRYAELYRNDGNGNFSLIDGLPFEKVNMSAVAFEDIDNDGDQDLLLTGYGYGTNIVTKLYKNDGSGVFEEIADVPFKGVYYGAVAFSDIDNDGDKDVMIVGNGRSSYVTDLYLNDGYGKFSISDKVQLEELASCSIAFSDINNDNYVDLLMSGTNSSSEEKIKMLINDQDGSFNEVIVDEFEKFDGVKGGQIVTLDINNDNNNDIVVTGNSIYGIVSRLFKNVTNTTLGLNDENINLNKNEFLFYPNPLKDKISIDLKKYYNKVKVIFHSVEGKLLMERNFENAKYLKVNVSNLPSNIYFVEIIADNEKSTTKLIKL